jgi:5-methylcytosine-specific restriction endonuclease McrA
MGAKIEISTEGLPGSRALAIAEGKRHFFIGTPCANGHIVPRVVTKTASLCVECRREGARRGTRTYYRKNIEACREAGRKSEAAKRATGSDWASKNREAHAAMKSEWKKANLERGRFSAMKRKAARLRAEPAWLTSEQRAEILALYREAVRLTAATGERYEVDHIVPLQGRTVSGLHVPWNLRILRGVENNSRPRIWNVDAELDA